MLNLSQFIGDPVSVTPPSGELRNGDALALGATEWKVLHTPGHSPGSVTLWCPAARTALVGDTLFLDSMASVGDKLLVGQQASLADGTETDAAYRTGYGVLDFHEGAPAAPGHDTTALLP